MENLQKVKNFKSITLVGSLASIIIVLSITGIGIIINPFTGTNITILMLPVIIGAIVEGPVTGMSLGLIFGLFSITKAFMGQSGLLTPALINPLISVFPRILIGFTAYYTYKLLDKLIPAKNFILSFSIAIGVITNTAGVLGLSYIMIGELRPLIITIILGNFLPEIIASVLIGTPVISALLDYKGK